jgi:hypothetical protein
MLFASAAAPDFSEGVNLQTIKFFMFSRSCPDPAAGSDDLAVFSAFVSNMVATLAVIRLRVIERADNHPYDGSIDSISLWKPTGQNERGQNKPGAEGFKEKKASRCVRAWTLIISGIMTWTLVYLCVTSLIGFFR